MSVMLISFARLAFGIAIQFFEAWVLSCLWNWFILPWSKMPVPPYLVFIAISMAMGLVTHQTPKDNPDYTSVVVHAIASPLSVLICGWLIYVTWA